MRKVTLGQRQEKVIADLVKAGRFASADEAVNELLEAGTDVLESEALFTAAERAEIEARLSRDEPRIPADQVFRNLREHITTRVKAAKSGA
jgi:Arc/MetJ-type ribon-helix-helix transcriptional regulator